MDLGSEMNILFPLARPTTERLMQAALDLGHKIVLHDGRAERHHLEELVERLDGDVIIESGRPVSEFNGDYTEYRTYLRGNLASIVENDDIGYIMPSSMDLYLGVLAEINSHYNLPGIRFDHGFLFTKYSYLTRLNEEIEKRGIDHIKVPVPYTISMTSDPRMVDIVLDAIPSYPVVCKPCQGTGGYGIVVAEQPSDIRTLLGPATDLSHFSELSKANQERFDDGTLRHHWYRAFGFGYMFQPFIRGDSYGITGVIKDGKPEQNIVHETILSEPPYMSEMGFYYDTMQACFMQEQVDEVAEFVCSTISLPDGPYMMDIMYDGGGVCWIVDIAPRVNGSSLHVLKYAEQAKDLSYERNTIRAALGENPDEPSSSHRNVYFRYLPLRSGRVETGYQFDSDNTPKGLLDFQFPSSDFITEPRHDALVETRGYAVTTDCDGVYSVDVMDGIMKHLHWFVRAE